MSLAFVDKDIIGKLYLHEGSKSIVIVDDDEFSNTKKRYFNGPVEINKIHFKLLDQYGQPFNLNNMDYSFSLEFEILYEKW